LNGVHLGLTQEQVIQTLGPPEMIGGQSRKRRQPTIFKYGNLETHFNPSPPHVCESIYLEYSVGGMHISLPERFIVEEWSLSEQADRREVEHYLYTNEIEFTMTSPHAGLPSVFTIPCSGVVINFDENGILWSISISRN
jgi:hypothetical protein